MAESDLESLLPIVDQKIGAALAREHWLGDEADDAAQWIRLKLVENKDRWLAAWTNRASMSTYLTVIVTNLVRDYRNHRLGKWRPSAAARRAGDVGIRLDQLLHRDQRTLDEAVEILRRNEDVELSAEGLRALAASLPPHYPRRFEPAPDAEPASPTRADDAVRTAEGHAAAETADRALAQTIASLPAEDRLLLKLRFVEGFTIAQIARRLGRPQRPLYRHFTSLYDVFEKCLGAAGVTKHAIADILDLSVPLHALTGRRDGSTTGSSS